MFKRLVSIFGILLIAMFLGTASQPGVSAGAQTHREVGLMTFRTPVKLLNVTLLGQYMFVHDDRMMARGEACTSVYELGPGKSSKPVVSFHCIPVERPKVDSFRARTLLLSTQPLTYELKEIQFAGSTEAHQVPAAAEVKAPTVNVVGCCF